MRPTRLTQPYRTSGSRPPSQVLEAMQKGRTLSSPGAALQKARQLAGAQPKRRGVMIPRGPSPFRRTMRP